MVDFEFDTKHYKRVDIDGKKYILVDSVQGSSMFFNRYPFRDKYDVYYGMMFYGCFPKGTKILGRKNRTKNIEEICVGDYVLSYNEKTGMKRYKRVKRIFKRLSSNFIYLSFSNGNKLRLTSEHPIAIVNDGKIDWIAASDINIGDKVMQKINPSASLKIRNNYTQNRQNYAKRNTYKNVGTLEEKYGKEKADEIKSKMSISQVLRYKDSEQYNSLIKNVRRPLVEKVGEERVTAVKQSISVALKKTHADPNSTFNTEEYKQKRKDHLLKIRYSHPSKQEVTIAELMESNFPGEWKHIKKNFVKIAGYNPDFVNARGKKKLIEYNGCYYHCCQSCGYDDRDDIRCQDSEKQKAYKENGYECLVLWEHDKEDEVIEKVENFIFNPESEIVSVIYKSSDWQINDIAFVSGNDTLRYKMGVYSIWQRGGIYIVAEFDKRIDWTDKLDDAISRVNKLAEQYLEEVYNFEVEVDNNYFAEGILVHNCWEPILTKFIKNFVKPKMKVADVGVYLGYYSLMMAKLVGEEGVVHAFEPSSDSIKILDLSAKVNDYNNIESHEMALSNFDGVIDFDDSSFLIGTDKDNKKKVTVNKLDSLDIDLDFMKIDTDGYDGNVIAGALNTIKKNGTVVALEYFPQMWAKVGIKPSTFFSAVSSNNLNVYVLGDDCKLEGIKIDALLKYPNIQHLSPEEILKSDYPDITLILSKRRDDEISAMCKKHV